MQTKNHPVTLLLICITVTLLATNVAAQEKKIDRSQLPAPVEATVKAQSEGATVSGFSTETEHGQTYYEAELKINGHSKDLLMDAQGNVVEIEEEVGMDALPDAVKGGLQTKAGDGKLLKIESLTKHGTLVAYEAQVIKKGKKSEIQVGPDGKPLAHEE